MGPRLRGSTELTEVKDDEEEGGVEREFYDMQPLDFFQQYQHLRDEDELRRALAAFVEFTRPLQKLAPKPERMARFLASCGHPEQSLRVIHLAGTSGKGSTTTCIATLLQSQGFRVGMTISPHVRDVRERIQIDGTPIAEEDFRALVEEGFAMLARSVHEGKELLHFFEFITALALIWFARQHVDYAVIETGLGGRFDATNVLRATNKFCVFTPIDLDHQRLLGNTPAVIAKEKSGIMVPGGRAWSAPQQPEVVAVLTEEARTQQVQLTFSTEIKSDTISIDTGGTTFSYHRDGVAWSDLRINAIGLHQAQNATVALDVVNALAVRDHWQMNEAHARQALKAISLPGRFEIRHLHERVIVLDVAHNPQKMESLLQTAQTLFPYQPIQLILGLNSLDHAAALAQIIKKYDVGIFLADMEVGDSYQRYLLADANELTRIFTESGLTVQGKITDLESHLGHLSETSFDTVTLVCGSFYLVSHTLPILDRLC